MCCSAASATEERSTASVGSTAFSFFKPTTNCSHVHVAITFVHSTSTRVHEISAAMNPYLSFPYPGDVDPWVQPRQLETIASLFDIASAPISHCRVLELGCADGANLLHFAASYPDSQFVGVDIAADRIREAQHAALQLGLTNVQFQATSVANAKTEGDAYDYILCPGIYSWVGEAERNSILEIIQGGLSPNGVAGVSYNVFPGWHSRLAAREFIQRHVRNIADKAMVLKEARRAIDFLATAARPDSVEHRAYRDVQETFRRGSDHYIYHDYITDLNQPFYFHEFITSAQDHGLQFVSECEFHKSACPATNPDSRRVIDSLPVLDREQLIDFTINTSYRRSILCRSTQSLKRRLTHDCIDGLFASLHRPLQTDDAIVENNQPLTIEFEGRSITTSEPAAKRAFVELSRSWPKPVAVSELHATCQSTSGHGNTDIDIVTVKQALLAAFASGTVRLTRSVAPASTAGECPRVSSVNRYYAATGRNLADAYNRSVSMADDEQRWLLSQLDGTRTIADLTTALSARRNDVESATSTEPTALVETAIRQFEELLLLT